MQVIEYSLSSVHSKTVATAIHSGLLSIQPPHDGSELPHSESEIKEGNKASMTTPSQHQGAIRSRHEVVQRTIAATNELFARQCELFVEAVLSVFEPDTGWPKKRVLIPYSHSGDTQLLHQHLEIPPSVDESPHAHEAVDQSAQSEHEQAQICREEDVGFG